MENQGTLFLVATPIGNLGDITLRAIETLRSVEYIACEDTRKTGILLKSLGIERKSMFISYYEQSEDLKIPGILNLLINGKNVALVSDSGTPLISDPGYRLVREAKKANIKVVSIPGAAAFTSSLISSGQPPDKFMFLGFLPKKDGNKLKLLNDIKESNKKLEATIILYEAPHRLTKTLKSIESVFGDINISISRELTKIHEEIFDIKISEALLKYEKHDPKGEIVILFNPKSA